MNQFNQDEMLILKSPYSDTECIVNYRGLDGFDSCVVWTGKMQITVKLAWLRRQS